MPPTCTWVVKLGGALLATPALGEWLAVCAAPAPVRCLVVAGGGGLADEVRQLQRRWQFDDGLAHELAIETMRMHARMLAARVPTLPLSTASTAAAWSANGSTGALWLAPPGCAALLRPASWAVTADSIALWLAQRLQAAALIVVKALPAARLVGGDAAAFAAAGVLDQNFPARLAAAPLPVRIVARDQAAAFAAARRRAVWAEVGVACS